MNWLLLYVANFYYTNSLIPFLFLFLWFFLLHLVPEEHAPDYLKLLNFQKKPYYNAIMRFKTTESALKAWLEHL